MRFTHVNLKFTWNWIALSNWPTLGAFDQKSILKSAENTIIICENLTVDIYAGLRDSFGLISEGGFLFSANGFLGQALR